LVIKNKFITMHGNMNVKDKIIHDNKKTCLVNTNRNFRRRICDQVRTGEWFKI